MTNLVQEWFRVWEDRPGIWAIEEPLHDEQVKSYLVLGDQGALLIDTGMGVGNIRELVESITDLPVSVILSHAHNDHIGGAWQFDDVGIHESEASDLEQGQSAQRLRNWFAASAMSGPLPAGFQPRGYEIPGKRPTRYYGEGDRIDLGNRTLEVIHAPGHSRGGLVLLDRTDHNIFATDVVYLRSLYLLNPDSSVQDYVDTLDRLATLVPEFDRLYPAHGPTPIAPAVVLDMRDGMRAIAAGRRRDEIEYEPPLEGGCADVEHRAAIDVHNFKLFRVLIAR